MNELGKELAGVVRFFKWCVLGYFGFVALMIVGGITMSWVNHWSKPASHLQTVSSPVDDRGIVDYGER